MPTKHLYRSRQYRLPYFNYAGTGWYFITIITWQREPLFGRIENGVLIRSALGEIAEQHFLAMQEIFPFVTLEAHVVMQDHVHCLIKLTNAHEERFLKERAFRLRPHSVSSVIGGYKSSVTARARRAGFTDRIWQSRFHDRIIRSERQRQNVKRYIALNPVRWQQKQDERRKK